MTHINIYKNLIRKQIKLELKKLSIEEKRLAATKMQQLCIEFLSKNQLLHNKHIAGYFPINNEIDCINLITTLLTNNNFCYLPRINQDTSNLEFFSYQLGDRLIKNQFGIYEPTFNLNTKIAITNLDLILMPIAAFDSHGHRIGSGYGYYDRSLMINQQKIHCPLIGLAYAMQQVEDFIKDPWDLDLDVIITEKYYYSWDK